MFMSIKACEELNLQLLLTYSVSEILKGNILRLHFIVLYLDL